MKLKHFSAAVLLLGLGALTYAAVRPQPSRQDEMPQPTAEHKKLLEAVGEWEGTVTAYMPGMPETPSPAKQTVEAIGGFWIQSHFTSQFMGMDYVGTGVDGYDPNKKKYVSTWCDNMSSFLAIMEGEMDAKGEKLTMHWTAPDMTGAMAPHRAVTVGGKDTYTSTFYVGEGDGTKSMVIDMKRVKKAAK